MVHEKTEKSEEQKPTEALLSGLQLNNCEKTPWKQLIFPLFVENSLKESIWKFKHCFDILFCRRIEFGLNSSLPICKYFLLTFHYLITVGSNADQVPDGQNNTV